MDPKKLNPQAVDAWQVVDYLRATEMKIGGLARKMMGQAEDGDISREDADAWNLAPKMIDSVVKVAESAAAKIPMKAPTFVWPEPRWDADIVGSVLYNALEYQSREEHFYDNQMGWNVETVRDDKAVMVRLEAISHHMNPRPHGDDWRPGPDCDAPGDPAEWDEEKEKTADDALRAARKHLMTSIVKRAGVPWPDDISSRSAPCSGDGASYEMKIARMEWSVKR